MSRGGGVLGGFGGLAAVVLVLGAGAYVGTSGLEDLLSGPAQSSGSSQSSTDLDEDVDADALFGASSELEALIVHSAHGEALSLPMVTDRRPSTGYKSPHWVPVVVYSG